MSDFRPEDTPKRRCPSEARKSASDREDAKLACRAQRHARKGEGKLMTKAIKEQRWSDE